VEQAFEYDTLALFTNAVPSPSGRGCDSSGTKVE